MNAFPSAYRVQLGHLTAEVQARNAREAIAAARQRFCDELPRLWDVVQAAEEQRFEVTPLPQSQQRNTA